MKGFKDFDLVDWYLFLIAPFCMYSLVLIVAYIARSVQ